MPTKLNLAGQIEMAVGKVGTAKNAISQLEDTLNGLLQQRRAGRNVDSRIEEVQGKLDGARQNLERRERALKTLKERKNKLSLQS